MSSAYSHSWHWNQSVSVHWPASSWLMCSSLLHPQQDTNTGDSSLTKTSSNSILSLITENSISQSRKKASIKVTLFHLFYFYFLCLFGALGTVTHPKPSLFLRFKVVSAWLSMTYGGGGGARGPKYLVLSDLQHRILKKLY